MSKSDRPLIIDDALIRQPEIYERLQAVRRRFPDTEDGTDQFLALVPYLQYAVPFGEYLTLRDEGLLPRKYVELEPVAATVGPATESMALFVKYVNSPSTYENGYSFVLYGANGSGKTMLALFMLCGFIERGFSGYYLHFKDYMRIFNDTVYAHERETKGLLKHLYSCDLLVIDEVGKESTTTANVIGEFERLLKDRSAARLPTIVVTNLKFYAMEEDLTNKTNSFRKKYGASVHNVLLQRYRFLQFSKEGAFRIKMREEWQI